MNINFIIIIIIMSYTLFLSHLMMFSIFISNQPYHHVLYY